MEQNTSGQGSNTIIPQEIRWFNWGAYFLAPIWMLFHGFTFTEYLNTWGLKLGRKGNEIAWRKKHWESIEDFQRKQRIWSSTGKTLFFISMALIIIGPIVAIVITITNK